MLVKKITVMIQARTGSTRLPNKVLAKIENEPMIGHIINRVMKIKSVQQIALITTKSKKDKILLQIAKENGIVGFAGDTNDVLNRHYQCAIKIKADPIIRITSDCPLIDPNIVEDMIQFYKTNKYNFVSNALIPTYPDGLDTEIFSFSLLKRISMNAKTKQDREHVTTYVHKNPEKFNVYNYQNKHDLSYMRWTVDRKQDLQFVRKIYSEMKPKTVFSMDETLKILEKNPKILKINKGIMRNEGHLKSGYHR